VRTLTRLRLQLGLRRGSEIVFDHYCESELARLVNLFAHVDLERIRNLKILEVGAGLGTLGQAFERLGFEVLSTDGRREHVETMRRLGRKTAQLDLDSQDLGSLGEFDIILAFGVLYHLRDPARFLESCARCAGILFLETVVTDASEPALNSVRERSGRLGRDQALHGRGCRPSPSWVENACRDAGFDHVTDISTGLANWDIGVFDWTPANRGVSRLEGRNLRKMWIVEKAGREQIVRMMPRDAPKDRVSS
jgi:SAM-dependent methyltransferase